MNNHFANIESFDSNVYIADYTNQTKSQRGVTLQSVPFGDIDFVTFKNPHSTPLWGINLEKNSDTLQKEDGSYSKSAECILASKNTQKGWVCLVEMKYCKRKNVVKNMKNALNELLECLYHFRTKGVISSSRLCYLNISSPPHCCKEPFTSYVTSPEDLINYRAQKIVILATNTTEILKNGILIEKTV